VKLKTALQQADVKAVAAREAAVKATEERCRVEFERSAGYDVARSRSNQLLAQAMPKERIVPDMDDWNAREAALRQEAEHKVAEAKEQALQAAAAMIKESKLLGQQTTERLLLLSRQEANEAKKNAVAAVTRELTAAHESHLKLVTDTITRDAARATELAVQRAAEEVQARSKAVDGKDMMDAFDELQQLLELVTGELVEAMSALKKEAVSINKDQLCRVGESLSNMQHQQRQALGLGLTDHPKDASSEKLRVLPGRRDILAHAPCMAQEDAITSMPAHNCFEPGNQAMAAASNSLQLTPMQLNFLGHRPLRRSNLSLNMDD